MAEPIVHIVGPDNRGEEFVDGKWVATALFESRGSTVRECLTPFLQHFAAEVTPYAPDDVVLMEDTDSKYFWYSSPGLKTVVDIHIKRGADEICIKQNLEFAVQDGDRISLGLMGC